MDQLLVALDVDSGARALQLATDDLCIAPRPGEREQPTAAQRVARRSERLMLVYLDQMEQLAEKLEQISQRLEAPDEKRAPDNGQIQTCAGAGGRQS